MFESPPHSERRAAVESAEGTATTERTRSSTTTSSSTGMSPDGHSEGVEGRIVTEWLLRRPAMVKFMERIGTIRTLEDFQELCADEDLPCKCNFWFRDGECVMWEWPIYGEHEAARQFFSAYRDYNRLIGGGNPFLPLEPTGSTTCILHTANQGKDPDASFTADGRYCPNMIVEVASSQPLARLFQACQAYLMHPQRGCFTMIVVGIKIIPHGDNAELVCVLWVRQPQPQSQARAVDQNSNNDKTSSSEAEETEELEASQEAEDEGNTAAASPVHHDRGVDDVGGGRRVRRRVMAELDPVQAPPPVEVISFGNVAIGDHTLRELGRLGVPIERMRGYGVGGAAPCDRPGLALYQLALPWRGLLTLSNEMDGPLPPTVLRQQQDWVLDLYEMQENILRRLQMRRREQQQQQHWLQQQ